MIARRGVAFLPLGGEQPPSDRDSLPRSSDSREQEKGEKATAT